jgi:hypothetical protein
MRPEIARKYLRPILPLVVGMTLGRFGIPLLEPMTTYHVSISPHQGAKECSYALIETTHNLGRLKTALGSPPAPGLVTWGTYGEGSFGLACREEKTFDNTILDCRCE